MRQDKNNNFDLLRVVAASVVVICHSVSLYGIKQDETSWINNFAFHSGGIAVAAFFVISGFLITGSYLSSPGWKEYAIKRILRIYPGLIVCTTLTALVLGAIITNLPLKNYYTHPFTYLYLLNGIIPFIDREHLPGVLDEEPILNTVMWTLSLELIMYSVIGIMGYMNVLTKKYIIWLVLAAFIFYLQGIQGRFPIFGAFAPPGYYSRNILIFTFGSLMWFHKDFIKGDGVIILILMTAFLFSFPGKLFIGCLITILPLMILQVAYFKSGRLLQEWRKYGDPSYGAYIYGLPIQEVIIYYFRDKLNLLGFISVSFIATFSIGYLSWHLIEKRALTLRKLF